MPVSYEERKKHKKTLCAWLEEHEDRDSNIDTEE